MRQEDKAVLYKYMFIVSTVCGALGVYMLYKQIQVLGWILVGVWAVLAIIVRVLIIKDKKFVKNKKI
ncbi:hypothetical protein [Endomicrobium proavitum]|uniref:Uncharacterized protein n=1 Tax=Endomicrobium proavitum TaxID=1408281 RepID=A0A0G3WJ41_9BACT|nr:hypothetical protein [Endomicrobium proavitum]AKL97910.1 hypothetical protein Epro_0531 [Endomicrobium proavitum]